MLQHIKLFGLVINTMIGTWIIIYIYQTYKTYSYSFLKWLAYYTILFNLLFVGLAIYFYSILNLPENFIQTNISIYKDLLDLFLSLIVIFWLYAILTVILHFFDKKIPKKINIAIIIIGIVLLIGYILKILLPVNEVYFCWLIFTRNYIIENIIILELVFLIGMLFSTKKIQDPGKRKISKAFGYFYVFRYVVVILILILNVILDLKEPFRFMLSFGILTFLNMIPFIWIKYYFLKFVESMSKLVEHKIDLATIYEKFNISKREQEILKLILDGKTNKEIEDLLFISYHTVKNHVYNIFQKFGIKTRYELIHLITKSQN